MKLLQYYHNECKNNSESTPITTRIYNLHSGIGYYVRYFNDNYKYNRSFKDHGFKRMYEFNVDTNNSKVSNNKLLSINSNFINYLDNYESSNYNIIIFKNFILNRNMVVSKSVITKLIRSELIYNKQGYKLINSHTSSKNVRIYISIMLSTLEEYNYSNFDTNVIYKLFSILTSLTKSLENILLFKMIDKKFNILKLVSSSLRVIPKRSEDYYYNIFSRLDDSTLIGNGNSISPNLFKFSSKGISFHILNYMFLSFVNRLNGNPQQTSLNIIKISDIYNDDITNKDIGTIEVTYNKHVTLSEISDTFDYIFELADYDFETLFLNGNGSFIIEFIKNINNKSIVVTTMLIKKFKTHNFDLIKFMGSNPTIMSDILELFCIDDCCDNSKFLEYNQCEIFNFNLQIEDYYNLVNEYLTFINDILEYLIKNGSNVFNLKLNSIFYVMKDIIRCIDSDDIAVYLTQFRTDDAIIKIIKTLFIINGRSHRKEKSTLFYLKSIDLYDWQSISNSKMISEFLKLANIDVTNEYLNQFAFELGITNGLRDILHDLILMGQYELFDKVIDSRLTNLKLLMVNKNINSFSFLYNHTPNATNLSKNSNVDLYIFDTFMNLLNDRIKCWGYEKMRIRTESKFYRTDSIKYLLDMYCADNYKMFECIADALDPAKIKFIFDLKNQTQINTFFKSKTVMFVCLFVLYGIKHNFINPKNTNFKSFILNIFRDVNEESVDNEILMSDMVWFEYRNPFFNKSNFDSFKRNHIFRILTHTTMYAFLEFLNIPTNDSYREISDMGEIQNVLNCYDKIPFDLCNNYLIKLFDNVLKGE